MTSLTLPRTAADSSPARRVMFARTVRSEFTKVRSVRSTWWSLVLLVLAGLAWCVAYCLATVHQWPGMSAQDRASFDPAQSSVLGLALLGQLVCYRQVIMNTPLQGPDHGAADPSDGTV